MANVYSIEIGGKFDAEQLSTALNSIKKNVDPIELNAKFDKDKLQKTLNKIKSAELQVKVKFDSEQINRELNKALKNVKFNVQVSTSGSTVSGSNGSSGNGSGSKVSGGTSGNIPFDETALREQGATITNINNELGETEKKVAKIHENAYTTRTITAKINEETEDWAQSSEKVTVNYAKRKQLQEQANAEEEASLAKQEAAQNRELEILDRRLGKLKEGIQLQQGYSNSDVLAAAGLPSNATITQNGALTPTASGGTWDRFTVSVRNAAGAFDTYQIAINQSTGAMRVLSQGTYATNKALAAQGETLDRLIVKVAKWAALTTLVYMPIQAFKEALSTLKEVDSELVTIQKVTDLNESQIKSLTSSVYELASAYGRTADELLEMTATFARAGFDTQLEEMTELAALTQNVGDLTADEASEFIIAANAAWKLEGDYDSLMGIIDGLNEITNHSANDFQALSQGISVAGSVFSNAGESAQTFSAMLGTVVASTQRSGSEVARGLRTIAMNIRQIKGELDDGEIIDESSISDAAAALSSIGVSVSENGQLRRVSDVLTDLAEKWDTMTSAEQSYVATALAGKRQANVLIALMQNFDEYNKELDNYANGAGSALKENEIYLDSWEAKTAQLKATWTQFVSNIVETKLIKGALDVAIKAVDSLNNSFAQTVLAISAVTVAVDFLGRRLELVGIKEALSYITTGIGVAMEGGGIAAVGEGIKAAFSGTVLPILAVAGAIAAVVAIYDELNVTIDEQKEKVADLEAEYDKLYGENSEIEELLAREDELNVKEQTRLTLLKAQRDTLAKQIKEEKALADEMARNSWGKQDYSINIDENGILHSAENGTIMSVMAQNMGEKFADASSLYESGANGVNEYKLALSELVDAGVDVYEVLDRNRDSLTADEAEWLRLYETILQVVGVLQEVDYATEDEAEVVDELTKKINSLESTYLELNKTTGTVVKAQDELNEQGYISVETFDELANAYPEILKSSTRLANGYSVEEGALADLISSEETQANLLLYNAQTAAIEYLNSMSDVAIATNASTEEILKNVKAIIMQRDAMAEISAKSMADYEYFLSQDPVYAKAQQLLQSLTLSDKLSRLYKASSSSSSSSSSDPELDAINDYYDIIQHRIWLSEQRQGTYEEETEAYKKEVDEQTNYYVNLKQWAHDKANELRQKGYAEESEAIKKLQEIWWEAENWLLDLKEQTQQKYLDSVDDALDQIKDKVDAQKDSLDAQITKYEALIDLHDAYYDTLTEIEDEQASINKELAIAKESYQYLDEATRKMLFNESDYAVLSAKLQEISEESAAIYDKYQESINNLTEDNIYLAEQLTHEFEQQYEAKLKEYEIAKAELGLAKARQSLENAKANRNTLMLVNGQFQWVADPKAIKEALEEYADAEAEYNDAVKDASRERIKNELEDSKQALQTEKSKIEAEYDAIEDAWERITYSLQNNATDISSVLAEIAQDAAPELRLQIYAFAKMLSEFVDIDLSALRKSTETVVYNEDKSVATISGGDAVDVPVAASAATPSTTDTSGVTVTTVSSGGTATTVSTTSSSSSTGRTYNVIVESVGGSAPSGLIIGDYVQTNGGLYQIVAPNTSGASYNSTTGYWSKKISNRTKAEAAAQGVVYATPPYDNGGIAYGKGILLKDTNLAEGVLKPSIMADVLNPQTNSMFESFVSGVSTLLDGNLLKRAVGMKGGIASALGGASSVDDHSITVNGMTVTGQAAQSLAKAMRAVMPLYS